MKDYLRRKVLAEWRGYDLPDEAPDRCSAIGPEALKLVRRFGVADRVREADIQAAWRGIVGDFLADHSTPARLKDGILVVHVLQPTVHYELDRMWRPKILRHLRDKFGPGSVREVRFRLG